MSDNDSQIDAFVGSFKYALSNTKALLIGGLVFISSFFIVGMPLFYGYIIKSMRAVIKGEEKAPGFDDIVEMYVDGLKAIVAILPYIIAIILAIFLVLAAYFIPMMLMLSGDDNMATLGLLLLVVFLCIAILIEIVVVVASALLMYASMLLYADTGDIVGSMNPLNALRLIMKSPVDYIIAYISMLVVTWIAMIASILIVTMPWAMHFALTAASYIYGKFYRRTQPVTIEKPVESPSFT